MFWRRRMEQDLEGEIENHIALETEENIARGMAPDEARHAALRKFGNITRVKEDTRGVWVWTWLDTVRADVRQAFRRIRRAPGTAALAILSLAVAFIPSVTTFTVMDRLFLSGLPVEAPQELLQIWLRDERPNAERPSYARLSYPEFQYFRRSLHSTSGLAYEGGKGIMTVLNGRRVILFASMVNDEYFKVLGVPLRSRPSFPEDRSSLVISHNLWMREFGGAPDTIGRTLLVNGQPLIIGGIAGPGFQGMRPFIPVDIWIPVETLAQMQPGVTGPLSRRDAREADVWARLRPGVSFATAAAEIEAASRNLAVDWPDTNRNLVGWAYDTLGKMKNIGIYFASIGVIVLGILLAVACANVAGILLARAEERRHETAVRQALGASRTRLIREWMVDSVVLASAGAALGLAGARAVLNLLPGLLLQVMPVQLNYDFSFGPRVWAYAVGMVIVSAVCFGLVPAWRGSRPDLLTGLRHDAAISILRVRVPVRSLLIVAQVAAAEVLLFGAGLVLDTLWRARGIDPGFDPNRSVAMASLLASGENGSPRPMDSEVIAARLAEMAGVRRVAYGHNAPLMGDGNGGTAKLDLPGQEPRDVFVGSDGPGFLSLLGLRFVAGRDLERSDQHGVVVNMALAHLLDPEGKVVGRQIRLNGAASEIVGIIQDGGWFSLRETPQPRAINLLPPRAGSGVWFLAQVTGEPDDFLPRLRTELAAAQPGSTLIFLKTLRQHYDDALFIERFATKTLYTLGLLALLLTAAGLHGITSALFARRTREFAIRLAIGAAPRQIMGTVVSNSLKLAGIGLALGLAIALPAAILVGAKVQGFSTWSVAAVGFSAAIVIAAAIAAAAQPASRVLRIQPADVLRAE